MSCRIIGSKNFNIIFHKNDDGDKIKCLCVSDKLYVFISWWLSESESETPFLVYFTSKN